jgi:signal peptidase I
VRLRAIRFLLFGGMGLAVALRCVRGQLQFALVVGESMSPTFHHGDLVIGRRRVVSVTRGDAIIFSVEPSDHGDSGDGLPADEQGSARLRRRLKRIVAIEGDQAPSSLPQILRQRHHGRVPPGHVAVAGDNPHSEGSAQLGYVEVEQVESVVIGRLRKGR